MRCARARTKLGALLDGELPGRELDEVERHMEGCSACRGEFDRLRGVESLLQGALVPPEFPGFAERVAAEAARRRAAAAARPAVLAWLRLAAPVRAAAAFGCAAGLSLGIFLGTGVARAPGEDGDFQAMPRAADELGVGYLAEAPAGSLAEAYLSALGPSGPERGGSR